MKTTQKTYLKLFAAACIFMLSVFSYNIALSNDNSDCYHCIDGRCTLDEVGPGGFEGCAEISNECFNSGNSCDCLDPTAPCVG
ncbi:MAG: hypothetical protein ACNA8K_17005 [Cyclonatronaceae bacterium]